MVTEPSGCWRVSSRAARVRGSATPDAFSVWTNSGLSPGLRRQRDRKSTRLNSSHSQISYAVFCLKKKKDMILGAVRGRLLVNPGEADADADRRVVKIGMMVRRRGGPLVLAGGPSSRSLRKLSEAT